MPLTFLLVVGVMFAVTARFVLTSPRPEDTLAGPSPTDRGTDPTADTLATSETGTSTPVPTDWHLMTVSTLREAEQLLDWLENRGFADRELLVLGDSAFAVRWR